MKVRTSVATAAEVIG